MTGTISINGVSDDVPTSSIDAVKGVSGADISFIPDAGLPLHSRICFEGDSITKGSNGPTFIEFALMRSLGRFYAPIGYNEAVGGETAAQMASTTETAQVNATKPKVVVLLAGTNDLGETSDTVQTIFRNIRICIGAYLAVGAHVVNVCVLPRIDPVFKARGAQREADRLALNDMIRAQTDVTVVDVESQFDPTRMTITNSAKDTGLHPNYLGAIVVGNAVGDALNSLVTTDTPIAHSFDPQSLMLVADNPQLNGTQGALSNGATGVVADQWTLDMTAGSGLRVVGSKSTLNGRNAQRIVVSGTNAHAGPASVTFRNNVNFPGAAAGDLYDVWWDFVLKATKNLGLIAATAGTTVSMPIPSIPANTLIPNNESLSGVIRIPSVATLAAPVTAINMQIVLTFPAGADCAADIALASPYLAKVPAGR
ncbi:SGNH/GDSL hydrolase family protein [Bradyrhizobium sp. Ai1a-2]|uniref:SGNH/GDSL hydrolase family protein n=1 Tax=Bradyrhizobium sp. Ai1a-2 TaxID=196490 RepID=UPI000414A43E|nr:SGNH/GDSL hydrolase family protein [Bradyrhizobium sp. Ai1a-2]